MTKSLEGIYNLNHRRVSDRGANKLMADTFWSFEDLLTYVDEHPPTWGKEEESKKKDKDFCGTSTWEEAMKLARYGWPEGRAKMSENWKLAANKVDFAPGPVRQLDVGGAYPLTPLAAAGDPMCMINLGDTSRASKRIVRMLVNVTASWNIPRETIMNRGGAILTYIDLLEFYGYSVELVLTNSMAGNKWLYITSTTGKRAGEPLEVDRLAFMLAHPSFLRRFMFASLERTTKEVNAEMRYGYGICNDLPTSLIPTDVPTIYFPIMVGNNDRGCKTLDGALKFVEKAVADLLPPEYPMEQHK